VEVDLRGLRFRHPLIRSAVYQSVRLGDRHAAHLALAEVLRDQTDRSVWHRSAALLGPDGDVASALEEAAERAIRRGAVAVAVSALRRAAVLSEDAGEHARRLVRAADAAFELGRRDLVRSLLHEVDLPQLTLNARGRMAFIEEMVDPRMQTDHTRTRRVVQLASDAVAQGEINLALDLLWLVATRSYWADPGDEIRESVIALAEGLDLPDDHPKLLAVLAYASPFDHGRSVVRRLSRWASDPGVDGEVARTLGTAAIMVGAFEESVGLLNAAINSLRAEGRLGHLPRALGHRAWAATHLGDWDAAILDADEAMRLAAETDEPLWGAAARAVRATLAGLRGDEVAAERLAAEADRVVFPMGAGFLVALAQIARGATALSRGRHADAFEHLRRLFDPADPAHHPVMCCWAIADLVEAGVQSGHHEAAQAIVDEFAPMAERVGASWMVACVRYARPLLAADEDAETLFRNALDSDIRRWPLLRGRLLLAYGGWLRRRRRVAESRVPLRAAREAFDALGALPWGERARQELRASGESSSRLAPEARDQLTPQELQIARMAAEGLSNRDIGERLFLSHRTIGSHLYRIFPKLGITGRAQLGGALTRAAPMLAAVAGEI
jgi:DNA-binding CsgD family transcriptional regulator/tetratricopeptide (TPR) repeat protein